MLGLPDALALFAPSPPKKISSFNLPLPLLSEPSLRAFVGYGFEADSAGTYHHHNCRSQGAFA
jgi:hypothetical protein